MVRLTGGLYADAGAARVGITAYAFAASLNADENTSTGSATGSDATDASGEWDITGLAENLYDVRIDDGTTKRWRRANERVQLENIETSGLQLRNPADTFVYDIVPAAITANRTLNLPLITGTDTLEALGLAQTITAIKTFAAIPLLSGGAISFPATQVPSAGANDLDDYEEGTWTPGIADDTLDGSGEAQAYTQQFGTYTKIGRVVYVWGVLEPSSLGTLTTTQGARITGLPFTGGDTAAGITGNLVVTRAANLALPVAGQNVTGYMVELTTSFTLELWDSTAGTSALLLSEYSADGAITFYGSYTV